MKTGELIRKYRKKNKLTMKQLGEKINVSEQAISQYERGLRNVNLETLIKISTALNTSIEKFISLEDSKIETLENILDYKLESLKNKYSNQVFKDCSLDNVLAKLDLDDKYQFLKRLKKVSLLAPILESYGVEIKPPYKEGDDIYITIEIKDKDFYQDFYLDDFIDFIDKIFWSVERELDYLIHLYAK